MARIRSIKPEFWTSEQVVECSAIARLLFIGMWNFCDDAGNHPASCKTLKMEIFPGDDFTVTQIQSLMDELIAQGLVVEYAAEGRIYWHVTGWSHQKIDKPNRKHPPFSATTQPPPANHSTTTSQPFDDHSTTEGKGEEGIGEERKGREKPFVETSLNSETLSATDAKNGKSFISPDFLPNEAMTFEAQKLALDLPTELAKFIAHHRSKRNASYDWNAELHKWLLNAHGFSADRQRDAKARQSQPSKSDRTAATIAGLTGYQQPAGANNERTIDAEYSRI